MFQSTLAPVAINPALDNEVVNAGNRLMVSDKVAEAIDKLLAKALKDGEAVLQPEAPIQASVKPVVAEAVKSTTKKASSSKKQSKSDAKLPAGVLKIDRYGNQWIAEYDEAAFKAMKQSFINAGKYDSSSKNRCHDIYKALGWIK